MSLMAANEESDPSAILNGFWVTLIVFRVPRNVLTNELECVFLTNQFGESEDISIFWQFGNAGSVNPAVLEVG